MVQSEVGGAAGVAGVNIRQARNDKHGLMDLDEVRSLVRYGASTMAPRTAVICLENTHNFCNGSAIPASYTSELAAIARGAGAKLHIDGARIFNAAIAQETTAKDLAREGDSVSFCLSKGLSAPVGSLLCGTSGFVERARAFRRMVGGNMRQAGPLAAAGIVALETMVDRLIEDHRTAKRLAEGFRRIDSSLVDPGEVDTNLVRVEVKKSGRRAAQWSADLQQKGILVSPCETYALRFVTHRHTGEADVDATLNAFAKLWQAS
jgi:threonine aldolase